MTFTASFGTVRHKTAVACRRPLAAFLALALGACLAVTPARAQAQKPPSHAGKDGLSPEIAKLLDEVRGNDTGQLAVSAEDGRFLRILVASSKATRVLEIGGASGYSAIWMGLGLRDTGGKLTTIEYDPVRAKELAANIKRAGLSDIVTVIAGDAFAQIPKLQGEFDFVFLDAWKKDYKKFFDMVAPRVVPGGLFLAHNVVNKKGEMQDFLSAIESARGAWSAIVSPSGEGISITYKRRN
jgi:caffeoyl-CoA O-methyltransferase